MITYDSPGAKKVYKALLSQSGTEHPVATVLVNSFGDDIAWTRDSAGEYHGTLAGAFISLKTFLKKPNVDIENVVGTEFEAGLGRLDVDVIVLKVYTILLVQTDEFNDLSVEIEVYPE